MNKKLSVKEQNNLVETITGKVIISTAETVELFHQNKKIKFKARIDTGARISSIDIKVAEKLGLKNTSQLLKELNKIKFTDKKIADIHIKKITKSIKKDFNFVQKLDSIKSTHGVSIRPVIKIKFILKGQEVNSLSNIYDRSKMEYPMLVGRNSLKKYLVKVN